MSQAKYTKQPPAYKPTKSMKDIIYNSPEAQFRIYASKTKKIVDNVRVYKKWNTSDRLHLILNK